MAVFNSAKEVITLRDVSKRFGRFTALDDVSMRVLRGEVFGFLGPNGAGKTTTIRILCGILRPSAGDAFVSGIHVNKRPEKVKPLIGYVSQNFSLYSDLSVQENLLFFGSVYGMWGRALRARVEEVLGFLGLEDVRKRRVSEVSKGLCQRLALGCAILHRPRVLFLDEPTAGVDPLARRNFWKIITRMAHQGTTVLVTTHYMDEAEYCTRISIMHRGRILALGTLDELKSSHDCEGIEEVFLRVIKRV